MENTLRENQLTSLGKLLASYTHELKNHLAIINESSGLMDDLLSMGEGEPNHSQQRLKTIIKTISERIAQANRQAKYLNSLAHRLDQPTSSFNVNEIICEELALIERHARLQSIVFEQNLDDSVPATISNPGVLGFIFFSLVNELITTLDNGSDISFSSKASSQSVEISISTTAPITPADPNPAAEIIQYAAEKIGLTVIKNQQETAETITLILPIE